jgi:hypothetical protein
VEAAVAMTMASETAPSSTHTARGSATARPATARSQIGSAQNTTRTVPRSIAVMCTDAETSFVCEGTHTSTIAPAATNAGRRNARRTASTSAACGETA